MAFKYPMEPPRPQRPAATVVDLDGGSSSAGYTNICNDVRGYECIPWDTYSTLDEAQAALRLVEERVQAQWMVLIEQDSSWVESMSEQKDISCLRCTNGHGVCARQRLGFEMPTDSFDHESTENAEACMSDTTCLLGYDTKHRRGKVTMTTRDTVTTSVSSALASTSHHKTYAFGEYTVEAL